MKSQLNIGIIGVGRWGVNYFKTFNELSNAKVKWICATKEATLDTALSKVKPKHEVKTTTDYWDILKDGEIDVVAIASDASTHYKFSKEALHHNKHVIVEKPVAFHAKHVKELIKIANKRKLKLLVGHLHTFNPGIQKLKCDIDNGAFGKINYLHILHLGNGPVRSDIGAIWDFFPHSVSILLYLLKKNPLSISVNGASYLRAGMEDIAAMDMTFPDGIFTTSLASWLYPIKKMEVTVAGEKLYATFDDYASKEKLKYYDSRPKIVKGKVIIEDKGYSTPEFRDSKPLTEQLKHFLKCIENKMELDNAYEALRVTKILEYAQLSLNKRGLTIKPLQ